MRPRVTQRVVREGKEDPENHYAFDHQKVWKITCVSYYGYDLYSNGKRKSLWKAKCECGKVTVVRGNNLRTGNTLSCGCYARETTSSNNRKFKTKLVRDMRSKLFWTYQKKKLKGNVKFGLSKEELLKLVASNCYYCGTSPGNIHWVPKGKKTDLYYNGIDRIVNKHGYVMSNCVPCCKRCNYAKGTKALKHFLTHVKQIVEYRK